MIIRHQRISRSNSKGSPLTKPALFRTWIRQQILNSYQNPGVIRILCFVVVLQKQLLHDSATLRSKVSTWWECELQSLESNIDLAEPAPKLNWIECFRLRQFRLGGFVRFLRRHKRNIIIIRSRVILFDFLRAGGLSIRKLNRNNHFRDFLFAWEGSALLRTFNLRCWSISLTLLPVFWFSVSCLVYWSWTWTFRIFRTPRKYAWINRPRRFNCCSWFCPDSNCLSGNLLALTLRFRCGSRTDTIRFFFWMHNSIKWINE